MTAAIIMQRVHNTSLIHCIDLSKTITDNENSISILKEINLTINIGDFISILGKSGSGKTTLLSLFGLLDSPSNGDYLFQNISVKSFSPRQRAEIRSKKIGFVFQNFHLLPYMSLLENVCLPLFYQKISYKEQIKRAKQALDQVGLRDKINSLPNQVSGGQKQRCAIARAIVTNPILLLADEATGNLDTENSENILNLFKELITTGMTIVMVTHDQNLTRFSNRIIKIQDGRILYA